MKYLLSLLVIFTISCVTSSIESNTYKTLASARETMSAYVKFADANRSALPLPALRAAERIRVGGADYLTSAHISLASYIDTKSDVDKSALDATLLTIQNLINEALKYMTPEGKMR